MMWRRSGLGFVAAVAGVLPAVGQDFDHGPVAALIEENDLVVNTDRHYTQGIRVSFLGRDNFVPGIVDTLSDALPAAGYEARALRTGIVVGQSIFTPADTGARQLLRNDRPYAGWLYIGLPIQRRGLMAGRWLTLESLQLDLGVVGDDSLADKAQTWVHEVRGFELPQGWDNQLETEPGIALKYQRSICFAPANFQKNLQFIPHGALSLGNVETSLRTGFTMRAGLNLPDNFGPQTINSLITTEGGRGSSYPNWSAYIFGSVEGGFVAYSTFLDGNMYHKSHSVQHDWAVAELRGGAALGFKYGEIAMTYVHRTREFRGQDADNSYGSVSFTLTF